MFGRGKFQTVGTTTTTISIVLTLLFAQPTTLGADTSRIEPGYFVISNGVVKDNRELHILLNQEFFNVDCLREILKQCAAKYPEPDRLDIYLYSSLEQIRGFVDGRPHHGSYLYLEKQDPGFWHRYSHGLLFREDGNEVIRYYIASGNDPELQTIIVKGIDPADSRAK